ncbi:IclR family transcriptional regulator [Azospirillum thermophilum]|uniref:IclR family transcriptional regulator n=1 Tax=Azospirillum thermophilum TaxID=2202148 RepID=A0A2S2D080_9PROT|nr:IclR family transcriptional regulator [Azospirillum thermophilum]AWK90156.1 IclR family transcriptional regulator [Azospirillum thermophilum]
MKTGPDADRTEAGPAGADAAGTAKPGGRARGIDRVIALMEHLHRRRSPTRIADIARETGTPRSTVYELVNTLVEARWLELRDGDGTVYFGPAMHYYGSDYLDSVDLIRKARIEVAHLAETVGETAQFCTLEGDKYLVVLNEPGRRMFRISSEIGIKVPIPWTASGRLLVDHMSAQEILDFIPSGDFTLPDGRRIGGEEFLRDIERARAEGHVRTTGLVDRFTTCLAAPVRDGAGRCIATICFVIPADTGEAEQQAMIATLKESAEKLSVPR